MDIINTDAFKFFFNVIVTIILIVLMKVLIQSAIQSFKTSHKWSSVIDEIVVGLIVICVYAMIVRIGPATLFKWVEKLVTFFWNIISKFIRQMTDIPL